MTHLKPCPFCGDERATNWRDISTAPKNTRPPFGSLIGWLVPPRGVFGTPRAVSIFWELNANTGPSGYWFHTDGVTTEWQPSHWMPCDPPEATA